MARGASTRALRAGLGEKRQGGAFLAGPQFAGTYYLAGEPASSLYTYGRFQNPTWTAFESALADLEEGPALAFASGMAAVAAVFGIALRPGDVAVLPEEAYYTARLLARGYFAEMGVDVRLAPTPISAK